MSNNIIKFDAGMFEDLLEVAASSNTKGGSKYPKKPRQNFVKHPGIKMSIQANKFAYKIPNKKGILVEKDAKQIRAVILDSNFSMAQWGKEDNKPKMLCSSIKHTNLNGTEGSGSWQIPLRASTLTEKLNPQGFKGMSCAECIASKGNEGCKQSGAIHVYVTGIDSGRLDEEDEPIGVEDCEPFIAHISASGMSAFQYTDFLQKVKSISGKPDPDSVQAVFSTQQNPKAPVMMLKIDIDSPFSETDKARKLLADELARLAEAEAKRLEEWKAKNGIANNKTAKPAAQDDDLPF